MNKTAIGYIYLAAFCVLLSLSNVMANFFERAIPPEYMILYSSFLAALFFGFLNFIKKEKLLVKIKKNLPSIIFINFATLLNWGFLFFAFHYISGAVVSGLEEGVIPIVTFIIVLSTGSSKKAKKIIYEGACAVLIFFLALLIAFVRYSDAAVDDGIDVMYGLVLALIAGVGAAGCNVFSKRLNQAGFSAINIMGCRFLLMTVIALMYVVLYKKEPLIINYHDFFDIVMVAMLAIMIPIFFLQKSIEKLSILQVAFPASIIPVITFLIQLFQPNHYYNPVVFFLICMLCVVIILSVLVELKSEQ